MQNRRKTIVINKKFQYQYSLLIAAVTVLSVNIFLIIKMLMPGEDPLIISSTSALGIGVVELALVGSIWYASLKASHRIAGPVYVFARDIARIGKGDLTTRIKLRQKDMFLPEADQMNASFALLEERLGAVKRIASELETVLSTGGDGSPLVAQLQQELSELITAGDQA